MLLECRSILINLARNAVTWPFYQTNNSLKLSLFGRTQTIIADFSKQSFRSGWAFQVKSGFN